MKEGRKERKYEAVVRIGSNALCPFLNDEDGKFPKGKDISAFALTHNGYTGALITSSHHWFIHLMTFLLTYICSQSLC